MAKKKQKEMDASEAKSPAKETREKESLGNDYWDRVAEDAASGYENKEDEDKILNVDQLPGDNERGDKEPEE